MIELSHELITKELNRIELSICNLEVNRIGATISNSSSVTASILCLGYVLTELLFSNRLFWLSGALSHSSRICVLVNCHLAVDYSGFQASCYIIELSYNFAINSVCWFYMSHWWIWKRIRSVHILENLKDKLFTWDSVLLKVLEEVTLPKVWLREWIDILYGEKLKFYCWNIEHGRNVKNTVWSETYSLYF
jgi:hypothetical protein